MRTAEETPRFWELALGGDVVDPLLSERIARDLAGYFNYEDIDTFGEFDERIEANMEELVASDYLPDLEGQNALTFMRIIDAFDYYDWSGQGPFNNIVEAATGAIWDYYAKNEDQIKDMVCELLGVEQ